MSTDPRVVLHPEDGVGNEGRRRGLATLTTGPATSTVVRYWKWTSTWTVQTEVLWRRGSLSLTEVWSGSRVQRNGKSDYCWHPWGYRPGISIKRVGPRQTRDVRPEPVVGTLFDGETLFEGWVFVRGFWCSWFWTSFGDLYRGSREVETSLSRRVRPSPLTRESERRIGNVSFGSPPFENTDGRVTP